MSTSGPRVPIALRLAVRLLPREVRDEVLGDLMEHRTLHMKYKPWLVRVAWAWSQPRHTLIARFRDHRMARGKTPSVRGVSRLDVTLALRMLLKHPGLTLVSVIALSIGIPTGLFPLHILDSLTRPLPVERGEDIMMVSNYSLTTSSPLRPSLQDLEYWREDLTAFEELGMFRTGPHSVAAGDGRSPVAGAEVTASVFSILSIAPLMGRPLVEADEAVGGPDVVVIGYDLWQARTGGDPEIIGSTMRIDAAPHTVVGVMPKGFLLPIREQLWLPLRPDGSGSTGLSNQTGRVMGRLAEGVSLEEARTEIARLGRLMATAFPTTHAELRPGVQPYTDMLMDIDGEVRLAVLFTEGIAFILLVLACGNVGILILARTATRSREIAIRTALGASRSRIVFQLFIESLLLALLSAGVGLLFLQGLASAPGLDALVATFPSWVDLSVSLETALLMVALAVISAVIAGVLPAFKATGKSVQVPIQRESSNGSGVRFGTGYSILIVSEVAVAVCFLTVGMGLLPIALSETGGLDGLHADQYLSASVRIPGEGLSSVWAFGAPEVVDRVANVHQELERRLMTEPGLGRVAIGSPLPGTVHNGRWIQIEGIPPGPDSPAPAHKVQTAQVDVGFFDALEQPILSGRGFTNGDIGDDRSAIIVNTSFVERILGGRNPIGLRVRYWSPGQVDESWPFEIVGVVGRLGMNVLKPEADQGIYHAIAPGELHPISFAVRAGAEPTSLVPRLRSVVADIGGSALIENPASLAEAATPVRRFIRLVTSLVGFVAGIAILLSSACLYALMSFTVTQRTRESGIRAALGAQPLRIVTTIARRALVQLSLGALIGGAICAALLSMFDDYDDIIFSTGGWQIRLALILLAVIGMGMAACAKPALRLTRIRPMDALRG